VKIPADGNACDKYIKQITLAHKLTVYAMKTKRTTDQQFIEKLRNMPAAFEDAYFTEEDKERMEYTTTKNNAVKL